MKEINPLETNMQKYMEQLVTVGGIILSLSYWHIPYPIFNPP